MVEKMAKARNDLVLYEEFMGAEGSFEMRQMSLDELEAPIIELKFGDLELYEEFILWKQRYNEI